MTIRTAASCIAVISGTALAQPFVHHVFEPIEAREEANDLEILTGGEIAFVGSIDRESQNLRRDGWIVVHRPGGEPFMSWIIEDNDSLEDPLLATFEDPVDKNLIVLQQGITGLLPLTTDLVLFKIDPFSGALAYQWRYQGFNELRNLGMERDGETGLVAASVLGTSGMTQCTLLRFRNFTGQPVFHNRYVPIQYPAFDLRFFDVAVDDETGDIFATGSVLVDDPDRGFSPASEILIARFDPTGAPIWFRFHEPRPSDDEAGPAVGVSIEINTEGNPVVAARQNDPGFGPISVHIEFSRVTGNPVSAGAISVPQSAISPAYSSLESLPNGSMVISGEYLDVDGTMQPAMWSIDGPTTAFNWIYAPDVLFGSGRSAIPQPNTPNGGLGILLAGYAFPNQGAFGTFHDALLARTRPNGNGLCDMSPEIRPIPLSGVTFGFNVQTLELEPPNQAGLEVIEGDPEFRLVCEPCRPDLNMDGSLDFFDINFLLANMVDYNGDTVFDFFDISEFLMDYSAGCP
jgi:hypothetical protein